MATMYLTVVIGGDRGAFSEEQAAELVGSVHRARLLRAGFVTVLTVLLGMGVTAALVGLAHPQWSFTFAAWHTAWFVAVAVLAGGAAMLAMPTAVVVYLLLVSLPEGWVGDRRTARVLALVMAGTASVCVFLMAVFTLQALTN